MEDDRERQLIDQLKQGDKSAADQLIGMYFGRVVRAAERRLKTRNTAGSDGDDIAASVFESLWRRAKEERFAENDLADPDELWRLLSRMTQIKTDEHARRANAQKRGGGIVRGESALGKLGDDSLAGIEGQAASGFTPEELVTFEDSYQRLMDALADDNLQRISVLRMEGYKVKEIADELGKSERSIKRGLALVRNIWEDVLEG